MPRLLDAPPTFTSRLVRSTLTELVSHGALALPYGASVELSSPLRLYHLGAEAVARHQGLESVTPVGWWIEVRCESGMIGAMELTDVVRSKRGQPPLRFESFTTGALHRGLAAQVKLASSRSGVSEVPAAVVRAPALYFMALWLKEADGDVLVPIAPAPTEVQPGAAAPAASVMTALVDLARARMNAPDDGP